MCVCDHETETRRFREKRVQACCKVGGGVRGLLANLYSTHLTDIRSTPPPPHLLVIQVYSGEVDTVGSILAALNVTDWAWPPYASNIVLELWRRTESEDLPRVGYRRTCSYSAFFLFSW